MSSIQNMTLQLETFEPIFRLETSHTQTLLGHYLPFKEFDQTGKLEFLTLPDGDELAITSTSHPEGKHVVVLFHGLGGDSTSDYIQRAAQLAYNMGHHVVRVDHRGAGASEGRARKPYHSGRGEDASVVSRYLRTKYSQAKQIFIGFSLSGSVILNLITLRYGTELPDMAIVVNAPINLEKACWQLTKGFTKIYDIRFYFLLKKLIRRIHPEIELPIWGSTWDLDEIYTGKQSGFLDRHDYYKNCSTQPYVNNIQIPTFVLTSEDDPFIPVEDYREAHWNEKTHLTISKFGGHMGYISKLKNNQFERRWLDHYLHEALQKSSEILK